ncbi:MAG TPA: J domain-containing protein, partial [Spirochaetota bacterium]|nr:J domain-containing protein [Spirochaetota bacterium]
MNSSDEKLKHYRFIFGLSENYSREELRSAYATLARLNHPDKNPGADSLAKMVIINEAYSFL